jgi:hypothetical protein
MRIVIVMLMIMAIAASAIASDLGSRNQPVKHDPSIPYQNPVKHKQGGDTVDAAVPINSLPFTTTGTTEGFVNDYDGICPYLGSTSPDVVYSFTPASDILLTVDLCGSSYDTKTYIFDPDLNQLACNDDFYHPGDPCGDYVSKIEGAPLAGGVTYYIVVDGYGGEFGEYVLSVTEYEPCFVYCPADAVPEGEPPLHDGYDDQYNVGCSGTPPAFQPIDWTNDTDGVPPYDGTAWLCGKSGWFISSDGFEFRDTDWFSVFALETGQMEVTLEPEYPCLLIKVAPTDCAMASPELNVPADCGEPGTLVFPVTAGEEIWLWVGPTDFYGPVTEFTYFLTVSNNIFDVVSREEASWGRVKALYR